MPSGNAHIKEGPSPVNHFIVKDDTAQPLRSTRSPTSFLPSPLLLSPVLLLNTRNKEKTHKEIQPKSLPRASREPVLSLAPHRYGPSVGKEPSYGVVLIWGSYQTSPH